MKILVAAMAIAIAFPAAAQTAASQHQGEHQAAAGPAHPGHDAGRHHDHGQAQGGHAGHGDGCCADRDGDGRMDCCEQGSCAEHRQQPAQPSGHRNH